MNEQSEIFRTVGLSRSFGGVQALAGIDLELPRSGIVGLIGPNGSGKTTLLNVVTGFLAPSNGIFSLGGQNLTGMRPHRIAQLGIARTFQDVRLVNRLSVLENVMLAYPNTYGEKVLAALLHLKMKQADRELRKGARTFLETVGLGAVGDLAAGALSFGQQKLLALACCIATGARILFLDEPLAGVQPQKVSEILDLFRRLSSEARLIVFAEHDIGAVREVSDTLIVMDQGKILARGTPEEVLSRADTLEAFVA